MFLQNPILEKLEANRQDSSDNLIEHFTSLSNISTDASNMERINRWKCALQMFYERPFFGWGPGTYQFHYAPFQVSSDRTIISSNYGDAGNAHSEYLSALSESGVLGFVTFFLVVFVSLFLHGIALRFPLVSFALVSLYVEFPIRMKLHHLRSVCVWSSYRHGESSVLCHNSLPG